MSNLNENDFLQFFHKNYKKDWYIDEKNFKRNFISVENIAKKFMKTDINKGLDMTNINDIQWRKEMFGENKFQSNSNSTFLSFFFISMDDLMIKILFFLAIINIILDVIEKKVENGYKDGIILIISLLIYLFLMSLNDYSLYLKTLNIEKNRFLKKCKVIRNNKFQIILNRDLLVGDILVLNEGDIVEVDGFAIKEKKIGCDESALFEGENKYNIQYKSSKFTYNKNKKIEEYVCTFIFAGSYVVEGEGYLLVASLSKNIYKNGKLFYDMINNNEQENDNKSNNEIEEYEYYNEIGYYKMKISLFSEKIASSGLILFTFFGFILIIKEGILRKMEKKLILSLDYLYIIINKLIFILIGSLLAVPNNLYMVDFISFLFYEQKMKKNNIYFKHKKYPELSFIDTLIIFDTKKNFIFKDIKKEINKIIKEIKNYGINVILVTEKNFDDSLIFGKEIGIIENDEFKNAKKIENKYINLNKNNSINIESQTFKYLCGKYEINNINEKEKIKFSNIDFFKKCVYNLKILSEIKKEEKLILINGLELIGKNICLAGATIEDLKLLKMINISFGNNDDLDVLKENYSLILLDNSLNSFWKAFKYSSNLNYKVNLYIDFFISTFFTLLISNFMSIFFFKNLPINIFSILYLKIIVDLFVPYLIFQENSCKILISKNKNINNNFSLIFKICARGIILFLIFKKKINLYILDINNDLWKEDFNSIIFFIFIFMILIQLIIIIIKANYNFINTIFYFSIALIFQFFIIYFGSNIFRIKLLYQNNLIKCLIIALIDIPINIIAEFF